MKRILCLFLGHIKEKDVYLGVDPVDNWLAHYQTVLADTCSRCGLTLR